MNQKNRKQVKALALIFVSIASLSASLALLQKGQGNVRWIGGVSLLISVVFVGFALIKHGSIRKLTYKHKYDSENRPLKLNQKLDRIVAISSQFGVFSMFLLNTVLLGAVSSPEKAFLINILTFTLLFVITLLPPQIWKKYQAT